MVMSAVMGNSLLWVIPGNGWCYW